MNRIGLTLVLAAAVLSAPTGCGRKTPGSATGDILAQAAAKLPGGWRLVEPARVYRERELYDYIDGGADLYFEYGFSEAAVGHYHTPRGKTVYLNLFRMSDPDAAFGIFSVTRRPGFTPVKLGLMGARTEYQEIFCKGEFFIEVQAMEADSSSAAEMDQLCQAVDTTLTAAPGEFPVELGLLPRGGFIPHSEVLVRGPLGLNSRKYLADENIFSLNDSVQAALASFDMGGGATEPAAFLAVNYPDSLAAEQVFDGLREFYQKRAATSPDSGDSLNAGPRRLVFTTSRSMEVLMLRSRMITAVFASANVHGMQAEK